MIAWLRAHIRARRTRQRYAWRRAWADAIARDHADHGALARLHARAEANLRQAEAKSPTRARLRLRGAARVLPPADHADHGGDQ